MAYYYWNQSGQQQPYSPYTQFQNQTTFPSQTSFPSQTPFPSQTSQQTTTPQSFPSGAAMMPAGNVAFTTAGIRGEESYIENLLRLNRGKEAVFHFTVPSAQVAGQEGNTVVVRGVVVEAGRDHAVIREFQTDHYFLFPMVYFDFARFEEPITYLSGGSVMNPR